VHTHDDAAHQNGSDRLGTAGARSER
jgi:hypothetical protein